MAGLFIFVDMNVGNIVKRIPMQNVNCFKLQVVESHIRDQSEAQNERMSANQSKAFKPSLQSLIVAKASH